MASISSSNTSIPPSWLSENTCSTLRDVSFSSYLNTGEENYIRSLVTTIQKPLPKMLDDREIDVFRADKYFNGEVVDTKYQHYDGNNHTENTISSLSRLNLQPRTPSIHSESSWNSESALVRRVQRISSRNKNGFRGKKSSFFSSCYCCNDKSIQIDENESQDQFSNHGNRSFNNEYDRGIVARTIKTSFDTAEITRFNKPRTNNTHTYNTEGFTFQVSNTLTPVNDVLKEDEEFKRERKSIEMFGKDTRQNMQSWEAFPSSIEENSNSRPPIGTYNDTDSDTSSDLFEIECLSSAASSALVPTRHDYEPSEASVDWSVVTASAADFSTVSDSEEQMSVPTSTATRTRIAPKPRSSLKLGMLGGCKSQKAVRVATGNVYISPAGNSKSGQCRKVQRFSDSYAAVTRFQTEDKLLGHGLNRQSKRTSGSDFLYN